jgi:hypothetical protein
MELDLPRDRGPCAWSYGIDMGDDHLVAAPPDSAGHQGSFTIPTDELQCGDEHRPEPPSDQDAAEPGGRGGATWLLGSALAFILIVAFFLWARGC